MLYVGMLVGGVGEKGGGRVKCESVSVSWLGEVRMSVCVCMFVCSGPSLAAEYSTESGGE